MSSSDEDVVLLWAVNKRRRFRRYGEHPFNKENIKNSQYLSFLEMRNFPDKFFNYSRMSVESFDYLLEKISPLIEKENTNWKEAIPPKEKLIITLRFLAEGYSYHQLAYDYFRGVSTISTFVPDVCAAICSVLQPHFMPVPDERQWLSIVARYEELRNMPHCLGAIDGKHIRVRAFDNSGSTNFNYKSYFSTVLMASADADGLFITIDVGAAERNSDSGVFTSSKLGKWIQEKRFHFPEPAYLPNYEANGRIPYFFVADEAFPLGTNLMRPFPRRTLTDTRRIFNFRLSRARKSIECAFGMMAMKFRIFEKPMQCKPENVNVIVQAACVLHNYIKIRDGTFSLPEDFKYVRPNIRCIDDQRVGRNAARSVRAHLANYFMKVSPIPYQWSYLTVNHQNQNPQQTE